MNDLQKSVIIALAENDMGVERAAKAMHYHHNTVMYHIENIYKKTGLNPRCFFDLAKLYEMATGESIMEKMTTKEAIAYLQPIADNTQLTGYHAALSVAMEAMRERDKIVRCKECLHWEKGKDYESYCNHGEGMLTYTDADDFCSYGERRDA